MKMYVVSAALGVLAFLFLALCGQYLGNVPEEIPQFVWIAIVTGGAAVCGYLSPVRAWRWGAVIAGVQPLAALILIPALDSLSNTPQSSTGGMVAVAIFTVLAAVISPFAILASQGASTMRAGRA
jgi:hypothetical protein